MEPWQGARDTRPSSGWRPWGCRRSQGRRIRRANEILTTASASFAARPDPTRPWWPRTATNTPRTPLVHPKSTWNKTIYDRIRALASQRTRHPSISTCTFFSLPPNVYEDNHSPPTIVSWRHPTLYSWDANYIHIHLHDYSAPADDMPTVLSRHLTTKHIPPFGLWIRSPPLASTSLSTARHSNHRRTAQCIPYTRILSELTKYELVPEFNL